MVLPLNDNQTVELYDSLQELPAALESKMQGYLMQEIGIGGKPNSVLYHIEQAIRMFDKNPTGAKTEIENAHFAYHNAVEEYNPKHYGWACLVRKINGKPIEDYSETGLKDTIALLSAYGLTDEMIADSLELVKKNLTGKTNTIFPSEISEELTLFNDMAA